MYTQLRCGDVITEPDRLHLLHGGRFGVTRRRDLPRLAFAAALLFGAAPPVINASARIGTRTVTRRLERAWARSVVRVLALDLQVEGLENIDPSRSYVVAPLHEGYADAVALLHLPLPLRFVARSELAGWPVLGRYLQSSDHVLIDPESPVSAYRRVLGEAKRTFDAGQSLVMFPQGTILGIESAFSQGAFRLAAREDRPLLPVVLSGSHRVWSHPFSAQVRLGQSIRMQVLPAVESEYAADARDELQRRMKRIALSNSPSPRHFVPERDGWWGDYRYEIDPAFPELADRVSRHRETLRPRVSAWI